MARRPVKDCSTSLVSEEMQIKKRQWEPTLIGMVKTENLTICQALIGVRWIWNSYMAGGNTDHTSTLECSSSVS